MPDIPAISLSLTENSPGIPKYAPAISLLLAENEPTFVTAKIIPEVSLPLTINAPIIPKYTPATALPISLGTFTLQGYSLAPATALALTPVAPTWASGILTSFELVWPQWTLAAVGGPLYNNARLTFPRWTLTAFGGGHATLTRPAWNLIATGNVASVATAELTWPVWSLMATGLTGGVANAALTWPDGHLTAFGGGAARLTWPKLALVATGTITIVGGAELRWPRWTLTATGITGGIATAELRWPVWTLQAAGITGGIADGALRWPRWTLTAIGTGVVSETTYAINLSTGAVTQLLLGAFNKLVTAHGRLYGLRDGALVRLDGDLDGASTIPATIRFAPQQFGTHAVKRLDGHVYLNARENNGVTLTLVQDETTSWAYQTTTDTAPAMGTHRVKVGRGVTFHSLGLTIQNRNGGRLDIGGIELPVLPLSRKPR